MVKPQILPGEEGMGPYERGRRRYQQGDYTGALEAFNEAIDISSHHLLLKALDSRAATFEKLDKLQPALHDAKRMIELLPNESKGYLRCGKVLQLKGENKLALKIYERGLKKVKISDDDKGRGVFYLQKMFTKLRQAQDPGKSWDPLAYLPLELVQMVLSNLDMRDRVICLAVTKQWKTLLEASPKLWTTLDTSGIRKAMSQKSLIAHLRRSNYTLVRAIISMKTKFNEKELSLITKRCTNLKEMQIVNTGLIGDSLSKALPLATHLETILISRSTEIKINTVYKIFEACAGSLLYVAILNIEGNKGGFLSGRWPMAASIRTLRLQSDSDSCLDMRGLIESTPNVISATLKDWRIMPRIADFTGWANLAYLDVTNTHLMSFPTLPSTLKHLILNHNAHIVFDEKESEIPSLPLLEAFGCAGTMIYPPAIKALTLASIQAGNLKKLDMADLAYFWAINPSQMSSYKSVGDTYPVSATVEELSLASNCSTLNEEYIIQITNLYPNLKRLDVSNTKITGVAVKHWVVAGIKYLNLDECEAVGGDAVELARSKGVEVQFNFPSRRGGTTTFRGAIMV